MINDQNKLEIFENFRVDYSLPKYKKKPYTKKSYMKTHKYTKFKSDPEFYDEDEDEDDMSDSDSHDMTSNIVFSSDDPMITIRPSNIYGLKIELNSIQKFFLLLRRAFSFWKKRPFSRLVEPLPELSIPNFFTCVKSSVHNLDTVYDISENYEYAIIQARNCGQNALVEKLKASLEIVKAESHLYNLERRKYLTEDQLVEFVKKAPKGLRLDWMNNFTRLVPKELIDIKIECDEHLIFDNYVVLHYDPNKKSWAETKAEIEARKDPVLFGVLRSSRKLYYIGDWVDEHCDLTLEEIVKLIGPPTLLDEESPDIGPYISRNSKPST